VSKITTLLAPRELPASTTYDAGTLPPLGAVQLKTTEDPLTAAASPEGGSAAVHPTVMTTSFEVCVLVPAPFLARRRTKYVPLGTFATLIDAAGLLVSKTAMFALPGADPASTTYELGGSPIVGADHVRATVVPMIRKLRFEGPPGAASAA
jgi:hypothetical protein